MQRQEIREQDPIGGDHATHAGSKDAKAVRNLEHQGLGLLPPPELPVSTAELGLRAALEETPRLPPAPQNAVRRLGSSATGNGSIVNVLPRCQEAVPEFPCGVLAPFQNAMEYGPEYLAVQKADVVYSRGEEEDG